jgi:hypothetical protein
MPASIKKASRASPDASPDAVPYSIMLHMFKIQGVAVKVLNLGCLSRPIDPNSLNCFS